MHYVPESARDFLPEDTPRGTAGSRPGFHYESAPVYLLTAVVGLLMLADFLFGAVLPADWAALRTVGGFRLALLAAALGGARILYQTLEQLFEGRIGADLALTIAAMAAIVLGEYETAGLVVFVALCGESVEGFTVDRAQRAIRTVFDLCPPAARVLRDGQEVEVRVENIEFGDHVLVRPGERIAVDGRIVAGVSTVDQSALTGESLPLDRAVGDDVYAGTLNQFGSLTVQAERVGDGTTLAQVVRLVAQAAERKAPLERTADRFARLFLPFVLGAAAITLVFWRWQSGSWSAGFPPALGVLVVACPCPLILATPTAVMAAMAWLARTGVVVKGSAALERLAQVDTFAFDKTGTLTRGELALGTVRPTDGLDSDELLRVAALAEKRSEHLLARLVVREAEQRGFVIPAVDKFSSHPGSGVIADVRAATLGELACSDRQLAPEERLRVIVGNENLLQAHDVPLREPLQALRHELEDDGQTVFFVAVDGRVIGLIGVHDSLRQESREVLVALRALGIQHIALLTGDRRQPAERMGGRLGNLNEIEANLLPADKAAWIERREQAGHSVAMVGDGINDAPALAAANVGLALGGVGSDIAAEAGDLVLMGDPLQPLPGLLRLSRELVRNIRQSIWIFAFGMNALGMLACASGLLTPVMGAIFHEFSSLAVMLNAMRLLWFEGWEQTRLGRWTQACGRCAEQLAGKASPNRLVFQFLEHRRLWTRLALALLLLAWLMSGVVLVSGDEQAVVTRFGRHEATLGPGLYWRWPRPFETVRCVQVDRLRTLQIGFRSEPTGAAATIDDGSSAALEGSLRAPIEWTSEHQEPGYEPVADEALVLTGDEVLVELTAEVHFRIIQLEPFVYRSRQPDAILRATAEAVLRSVASRMSLDDLLTQDRERFERSCLTLLARQMDAFDLGIEIVDLTVLELHPPRTVVEAYRDVANALEDEQRWINEAQAVYASRLLDAAGERAVELLNATAKDASRANAAAGVSDWKLTDALWQQLSEQNAAGQPVLSGTAAATLNDAAQERTREVEQARAATARFGSLRQTFRNAPGLTAHQLLWQALEEVLSGRGLTIVDPQAAGSQRLLLGTPRLGAPAAASLFDSDRSPKQDRPPRDDQPERSGEADERR